MVAKPDPTNFISPGMVRATNTLKGRGAKSVTCIQEAPLGGLSGHCSPALYPDPEPAVQSPRRVQP